MRYYRRKTCGLGLTMTLNIKADPLKKKTDLSWTLLKLKTSALQDTVKEK